MSDHDDVELYLIWSNEHHAWWRPGACGYAKGLQDAGRYTRDGALRICRDAIPSSMHIGAISEIPVRLADIREFLRDQMIPSALIVGERR